MEGKIDLFLVKFYDSSILSYLAPTVYFTYIVWHRNISLTIKILKNFC